MSYIALNTKRMTRYEEKTLESAALELLDKIEELDSELFDIQVSRDDIQAKLDTALEQLEEANARIKELESES